MCRIKPRHKMENPKGILYRIKTGRRIYKEKEMNNIKIVIVLIAIAMMVGMTGAETNNTTDNNTTDVQPGELTSLGNITVPLGSANAVTAHSAIHEYSGAEDCDVCHKAPPEDFATSIHNTWYDEATETGKLVGVNDFCGAVASNEGMCGKCHGGFGLPTADFSPEQTDCLICHAPNYKKTASGPDPSNDYSTITPDIGTPTREYCLRCHATAGGGNNRKRGDLEMAMSAEDISPDLDVHMAADMVCQDCHTFEDHHVAGQGMDLRFADSDKIVTCDGCHNVAGPPHAEGSIYNDHMDKIACTTCHIVEYGKVEPAETERNWEKAFIAGMLTKEQNAKPEYKWWNRTQEVMDLGDPAVIGPDGTVVVASPGGVIGDPDSKIYAVRTHLGRQPWDNETLLGFHVPTVKGSSNKSAGIPGNMTLGIMVTNDGEPLDYTWVNTSRTLGLFHGVAPKEDALTCDSCHKEHALDYAALGYICEYDDDDNLISAKMPGSDLNLLSFGGGSHGAFFDNYTGAETCLACHEDEGMDIANSVHNTWMNGSDGKAMGINDFCGNIDSNGAMCLKCHTGFDDALGTDPEDVDCLICHAPDYKKTNTGPDMTNEDLQIAAKNVGEPEREYCLRCHAVAGGGNNRKRGDLELAMGAVEVPKNLDVHMAADMKCQDCHTTEDHHIAGQGMDLRVADSGTVISCDDGRCHDSSPHPEGSIYNTKHTDTLACTACHITSYGKVEPAETYRDWTLPFKPGMLTRGNDIAPTFAWWDRTQYVMNMGDDIQRDNGGYAIMSEPGGDLNANGSKIYAVRVHKAKQPWDPDTNKILPFKVGTVKTTGNMTAAIFDATGEVHDPVEYTEASRVMGLFHGVSPKEDALRCIDCHEENTMDYTELGFETTVEGDEMTSAGRLGSEWNLAKLASGSIEGDSGSSGTGPTNVEIENYVLPDIGNRCMSISATMTINSTGGDVEHFVVLVSGTNTVTGDILAGLSVQENTGGVIKVPVMITVPCGVDTGTYTLIPTIYDVDSYPTGDLYAIGEGRSVTIS